VIGEVRDFARSTDINSTKPAQGALVMSKKITVSSYVDRDWTIDNSNTRFLMYGDRVEFSPAGKLVRVRVIRGNYTVAVGAGEFDNGAIDANFAGRVGSKIVPFVDVRFEIVSLGEKSSLKYRLHPSYDAGLQPDQGGSAAGSGGSSSGAGSGGPNPDPDPDPDPEEPEN
jgi:hypothetical protein